MFSDASTVILFVVPVGKNPSTLQLWLVVRTVLAVAVVLGSRGRVVLVESLVSLLARFGDIVKCVFVRWV